ncbi:MAG: RNA polymerase sigma factor [Mucilaginibacter sp.]|uniref:RNA polymerase sigma factor n=1 Tax=Mucilaginibacter sp. TaxID=1882438 RepID=UPI0031A6F582
MFKPILKFKELILKCVADNSKAHELLYKSYYGLLMGIAVRYVTDEYLAEEVVNDSFVKIFKNLKNFILPDDVEQQQKLFYSWAGRIVSRTSIDHLRTNKKHIYADYPNDTILISDHITVLSSLHVSDILKLLDQLPALQRIIFNMYELEGFNHEEISEELNISQGHSRVVLARAKKNLRAFYHKQSITVSYGK